MHNQSFFRDRHSSTGVNRMSKSPVTVQQWIDTLPSNQTSSSFSSSNICGSPAQNGRKFLPRELSLQSDDGSSHCSSVESVLDMRKPDPEAVLLGLGFGPSHSNSLASRIPQRFLQPSKVLKQIDIQKFLEQQGELNRDQKFNNTPPASPAHSQPKRC